MTGRVGPYLIPLLLYSAFAAIVYLVQGPEPELNIDHVAYFKLADGIRAGHPDGAYWRDFDALHSYAILIAYATDLTGSHIASLKLLLAAMTVVHLIAFERLAFLFTASRPLAVLFSLLSALFVSFGASFWGMTDFAASLHRTLVVPFFVVILWLFLRGLDSPWRYASYPVLVALSLLHLSTYYLLLVLLAFEAIEFLILRRCQMDRRLLFFAAGFAAAIAARQLVAMSGLGFTNFVENTFWLAWGGYGKLPVDEAWALELYAFPWRNLPLPLPTLANLSLSYGVIFALSVAAAIATRRRGGWNRLDRVMLAFAAAVVCAAYGIQTLLWVLRHFVPIYPINFEEIRSINFIMIPSLYFVSRLVAMLWREGDWQHRPMAAAVVLAFALQPVMALRALPTGWREALLERMTRAGVLSEQDTFRMLYARQYLSLASEGPRFYYSAKGLLDWLDKNAGPGDRVLTNRDEITLAGIEVAGPFQNVVMLSVAEMSRRDWKKQLDEARMALASHDIAQVRKVAKTLGATLMIVPWPEPGALYQDENFSLLRVE